MNVLSTSDIKALCDNMYHQVSNSDSEFKEHIELLYRYGLRVSEVVQVDNIKKTEAGELLVFMKKTKLFRVIPADYFTQSFNVNNFLSMNELSYISEVNIQRLITRVNPYRQLFVGGKKIVTHVFRHNFAKQKMIELNSVEKVNLLLSEKTVSICQNYIDSVIYY